MCTVVWWKLGQGPSENHSTQSPPQPYTVNASTGASVRQLPIQSWSQGILAILPFTLFV